MPNTKIKAIKTTIFIVNPKTGTKIKAINIDKGMATATKRALLTPIKNININVTTKNPNIIVLKRLLILFLVIVL